MAKYMQNFNSQTNFLHSTNYLYFLYSMCNFKAGVNILPFWLLDSSRMSYLFPHGIHDECQNENEHFYLIIMDIDEKI